MRDTVTKTNIGQDHGMTASGALSGCPVHRTHRTPMASYLDRHGQGLFRVGAPALAREVLRRVEDFGPDNALTSLVPLTGATLRRLARGGFALPPVLASASGESHRQVRRLVTAYLSPARVEALGPAIVSLTQQRAAHAATLLEAGPPTVSVDLAEHVTRHVAPQIFGTLVGIDMPPLQVLRRWSRDSLELFWGSPDPDRQLVLAESAVELFAWLRTSYEAQCGTERDTKAQLTPDGRPSLFATLREAGVDRARILSLGFFLVIAGQETTAMLGDTALYRALRTPGLWSLLAEADLDTSMRVASQHVQEVLASESSVPTWRRIAVRDTELAGRPIAVGTQILVELSGAPERPREVPPGEGYGLAFGHGLHRCLGAKLAEMETQLMLVHTARTLPHVALAPGEPPWFRLLSFQAPTAVRVARIPTAEVS